MKEYSSLELWRGFEIAELTEIMRHNANGLTIKEGIISQK